jgi:hypothetical protein
MALTTTASPDGQYQFDLSNVPGDWVYMTTVIYQDVSYSSDITRLTPDSPQSTLDVTVYEVTTDPGVVRIDQLHLVLEIAGERLLVGELYTFSNTSSQVFVGQAGDLEQGTLRVSLPEGAAGVNFQRGFGSVDSFIPATDLLPTGDGYLEALPLRPGQGTLSLLVQYELPYENGMQLSHVLPYETVAPTLVLNDVGVEVTGANWSLNGVQTEQTSGSDFLIFAGQPFQAGDTLRVDFSGSVAPSLTNVVQGDESTGLIIGGVALILAAALAFVAVRRWQTPEAHSDVLMDRQELLESIAILDDAYQNGEIDEESYLEEREELKDALLDVWE